MTTANFNRDPQYPNGKPLSASALRASIDSLWEKHQYMRDRVEGSLMPPYGWATTILAKDPSGLVPVRLDVTVGTVSLDDDVSELILSYAPSADLRKADGSPISSGKAVAILDLGGAEWFTFSFKDTLTRADMFTEDLVIDFVSSGSTGGTLSVATSEVDVTYSAGSYPRRYTITFDTDVTSDELKTWLLGSSSDVLTDVFFCVTPTTTLSTPCTAQTLEFIQQGAQIEIPTALLPDIEASILDLFQDTDYAQIIYVEVPYTISRFDQVLPNLTATTIYTDKTLDTAAKKTDSLLPIAWRISDNAVLFADGTMIFNNMYVPRSFLGADRVYYFGAGAASVLYLPRFFANAGGHTAELALLDPTGSASYLYVDSKPVYKFCTDSEWLQTYRNADESPLFGVNRKKNIVGIGVGVSITCGLETLPPNTGLGIFNSTTVIPPAHSLLFLHGADLSGSVLSTISTTPSVVNKLGALLQDDDKTYASSTGELVLGVYDHNNGDTSLIVDPITSITLQGGGIEAFVRSTALLGVTSNFEQTLSSFGQHLTNGFNTNHIDSNLTSTEQSINHTINTFDNGRITKIVDWARTSLEIIRNVGSSSGGGNTYTYTNETSTTSVVSTFLAGGAAGEKHVIFTKNHLGLDIINTVAGLEGGLQFQHTGATLANPISFVRTTVGRFLRLMSPVGVSMTCSANETASSLDGFHVTPTLTYVSEGGANLVFSAGDIYPSDSFARPRLDSPSGDGGICFGKFGDTLPYLGIGKTGTVINLHAYGTNPIHFSFTGFLPSASGTALTQSAFFDIHNATATGSIETVLSVPKYDLAAGYTDTGKLTLQIEDTPLLSIKQVIDKTDIETWSTDIITHDETAGVYGEFILGQRLGMRIPFYRIVSAPTISSIPSDQGQAIGDLIFFWDNAPGSAVNVLKLLRCISPSPNNTYTDDMEDYMIDSAQMGNLLLAFNATSYSIGNFLGNSATLVTWVYGAWHKVN